MSIAAPAAKGSSRHWVVAAGALICMIAASVPLSGVSFYHPYIFLKMGPGTDQNVAQGTILLYFTLMMFAIVGSMIFIGGPMLPKLGTKWLMIIGSIVVAGALVIFWLATTPVMLYVAGIVLGLGYGMSYQLCPIVWVNNWFVAKKGLVLGLVTGGTGIGGIIWSFLVPAIGGNPANKATFNVDAYRGAYLIMAIVVLALTIPAALFLIVERPSQVGLMALGAIDPGSAASAVSAENLANLTKPVSGFTFAQALRSPALWLVYAGAVILGIAHAAAQIMAPYLTRQWTAPVADGGMGQAVAMYSTAMMVWTLGLLILKPTLGVLNDKFGVLVAMVITLGMQAGFFLFLPSYAKAGNSVGLWLPLVAMLFMSAGMSNGTVQPPLLTATAVGQKAFGKIWSVTGSAYTLGMAVGAPIWGLFYNPTTKSYNTGFMVAPFMLAAVIVLGVTGMTMGKKQYTALYEKELADWEAQQKTAATA